MRIFKTKFFSKWAKKEALTDKDLSAAVVEIEQGLIDANLGGDVYKKRVSIQGKGKRGGARTVLAYKVENKAFFLFGYAKSVKANISSDELKIAKKLASEMLGSTESELKKLLKAGALIEVKYYG
ncbi:type II toxin-antitoxin system RelE/ParE family toxin [Piscirickettsia litoralis]|uniref:Addiction module toxin RelE n=1 Tax=Piscirickettsia litoralis TaxID=1891921 RepID=A0ABX2ZWZ1_9GAMM|nr:type II toxin-antitoxin system RelE/ParE family toxin [Piscirickettsia litoralis]ODN41146.1 hypothetical protein BGC07_17890 [Piscirickettsia litoralis]